MSKGATGRAKSQDRKGRQEFSVSKGATGGVEFKDKMGRQVFSMSKAAKLGKLVKVIHFGQERPLQGRGLPVTGSMWCVCVMAT